MASTGLIAKRSTLFINGAHWINFLAYTIFDYEISIPTSMYLFIVNNRNTRKKCCKICSKFIIKNTGMLAVCHNVLFLQNENNS